jgi:hypothetical protein
VAVAITALIVGASTFLVVSSGPKTVTITSNATPSNGRLYEVVFKQSGECTPTDYEVPWSVTLGPWTVAEPSNASVPIDTSSGYTGPQFVNESVIVFSVPNGQYPYKITAISGFGNSTGADITVLLEGPYLACSMSSATSTCTQTESEPLYFIIRNSTTANPIGEVPVHVDESTPLDLCSPGDGNSTTLSTMDTNANGTIEVCCTGSTFVFSIAYLGGNYQVNSTAEVQRAFSASHCTSRQA